MINDSILNELIDVICKFVFNKNKNQFQIPLHEPDLVGTKSLLYLKDCIDKNWVSSGGDWVKKFEKNLCEYTNSKYSIALCNGTNALRLALHTIGVKKGDEVLVTPSTFVATANAISHLGATPHFVDIDAKTLSISPFKLDERLEEVAYKRNGNVFNKKTNKRISALLPVHVFGIPADFNGLEEISKKWCIPIVEDSAEALGSWYKKNNHLTHCGLLGDIGILSFNGNKIITTGGGGAILTNNKCFAEKARHLSTTAKIPHQWEYFHDQIAWNDRMPNINAALGCAQLENIKDILETKERIYYRYMQILSQFDFIEVLKSPDQSVSNNWLVTLRILVEDDNEAISTRNKLLTLAHEKNILLRPIWKSLHNLPMYLNSPRGDMTEAEFQEKRLINLPSSTKLIS